MYVNNSIYNNDKNNKNNFNRKKKKRTVRLM